jgi:hypothetical protein
LITAQWECPKHFDLEDPIKEILEELSLPIQAEKPSPVAQPIETGLTVVSPNNKAENTAIKTRLTPLATLES